MWNFEDRVEGGQVSEVVVSKNESDTYPSQSNLQSIWEPYVQQEIKEWNKQLQESLAFDFNAEILQSEIDVDGLEFSNSDSQNTFESEVKYCSKLAASLTEASNELRSKSEIISQKEIELTKIEIKLRNEYQMKLQECREASRRMEDDFKLEVKRLQVEKESLEKQIVLLREENDRLMTTLKEQDIEMEKIRKSSLSEDQTTTLLKELKMIEEKYEVAYRSKMFFKEQWARSMREIHLLRSRHREELSLKIRSNKEELKALGKMLPEAQMNESSYLSSCRSNPHEGVDLTRNIHSNYVPTYQEPKERILYSSESEYKLQELVQERDKLLNTGSYDLDHVLITKLNKEIRQILTESNSKFI